MATTVSTESLPANTVAVFGTLGGATIAVTRDSSYQPTDGYAWVCLGCTSDDLLPGPKDLIIGQANAHAGTCRSKPLPA